MGFIILGAMKKWLTGSILGIIVLSVVSNAIYDTAKNVTILSYLVRLFDWIYDGVARILTYKISVWILLLIIVVGWCIYQVIKSFRKKPDFLKYKKDTFRTWVWTWDYQFNTIEKRYEIANLVPHCPKDEVQLVGRTNLYEFELKCPACSNTYPISHRSFEKGVEIEALILGKIDKRTFETNP